MFLFSLCLLSFVKNGTSDAELFQKDSQKYLRCGGQYSNKKALNSHFEKGKITFLQNDLMVWIQHGFISTV